MIAAFWSVVWKKVSVVFSSQSGRVTSPVAAVLSAAELSPPVLEEAVLVPVLAVLSVLPVELLPQLAREAAIMAANKRAEILFAFFMNNPPV
jgi:hypothetical protein